MAVMPNEMMITGTINTDIVDVLCEALDCRFNLANACNVSDGKEPRCNLKQITVVNGGHCKNYEKYTEQKNSSAKKNGDEFLDEIRGIVEECSRLSTSRNAARVTAFSICAILDGCVMLDGSGEQRGKQYKVLTEDNEPVEFFHHDL